MSVILHTVDGGIVNAINDAKFYEELTAQTSGIVAGAVCTSAGGLLIHITSGWGIIDGRLFTIEAEDIEATPSPSGTLNGRLKLVINLASDPPISFETEASSSLPALTQEDLNNGGTVYELSLAEYDVNELAIENLVSHNNISITPASGAVVKSDTANDKTLTMSLSGDILDITYQ